MNSFRIFSYNKKYWDLSKKITLISLTSYIIYNQLPLSNKNQLIYSKNRFNLEIAEHLTPINYKPTPYLPDCLTQMIYSEIKLIPNITFYREFIMTEDKGLLSLDWTTQNSEIKCDFQTLIVILHGITEGSQASYIRETVEFFNSINKYQTVVIQLRGINNCPLTSPIGYHACQTEDLNLALNEIRKKYPNKKCFCIGISMGANIFVKLLGNNHDYDNYIKGFISISNPLNIEELEKRNRGGILEKYILKLSKDYVKNHKEILKKHPEINIDKIFKAQKYRDFDNEYTIKMFGFKSPDDYYFQSNSYKDVRNIKVPSLFLNSKNDKFSPIDSIDIKICKLSLDYY